MVCNIAPKVSRFTIILNDDPSSIHAALPNMGHVFDTAMPFWSNGNEHSLRQRLSEALSNICVYQWWCWTSVLVSDSVTHLFSQDTTLNICILRRLQETTAFVRNAGKHLHTSGTTLKVFVCRRRRYASTRVCNDVEHLCQGWSSLRHRKRQLQLPIVMEDDLQYHGVGFCAIIHPFKN